MSSFFGMKVFMCSFSLRTVCVFNFLSKGNRKKAANIECWSVWFQQTRAYFSVRLENGINCHVRRSYRHSNWVFCEQRFWRIHCHSHPTRFQFHRTICSKTSQSYLVSLTRKWAIEKSFCNCWTWKWSIQNDYLFQLIWFHKIMLAL